MPCGRTTLLRPVKITKVKSTRTSPSTFLSLKTCLVLERYCCKTFVKKFSGNTAPTLRDLRPN